MTKIIDYLNRRMKLVNKKMFEYNETYCISFLLCFTGMLILFTIPIFIVTFYNLANFQNEWTRIQFPSIANHLKLTKPLSLFDIIAIINFDLLFVFFYIIPGFSHFSLDMMKYLNIPMKYLKIPLNKGISVYNKFLEKHCKKISK